MKIKNLVMDWSEVYTSNQSMIITQNLIMDWSEVYIQPVHDNYAKFNHGLVGSIYFSQSMTKIVMDWLEV